MPLYEYECEQCSHRFELIRKFSDPPLDACPKCGGPVRKLFSSPAIQFKGSGWYITDYAKKSSTEAGQANSSKGSGEKSESGGGKADSDGKSGSGSTDSSSKSDTAATPAATESSSSKPSAPKAD